jgi:DNA-binding MarR family transcriptional regulator
VNYIELINQFWALNQEYSFTPNEKAVYFALLNKANSLAWKNPFNQSNGYLALDSGMSEPAMIKARNTLRQKGLIKFKSGDGRRNNTEYEILTKGETTFNLSDTLSDTLSDENGLHNNKLKTKTKLNKNNLPPNPRNGGECECSFSDEFSFEKIWEMYGKKGNRKTSERKWANLKNHCREAAGKHIPLYVKATPDEKFRKNFETYLELESWNDKIVERNPKKEVKLYTPREYEDAQMQGALPSEFEKRIIDGVLYLVKKTDLQQHVRNLEI